MTLSWERFAANLHGDSWMPTQVVSDGSRYYVGTSGYGRILVLDADGNHVDSWFIDELADPETLVVGPDGLLYIVDRDEFTSNLGPIYRTSLSSPSLSLWASSGNLGHWGPVFVGDRLFVNSNWDSGDIREVAPSGVTLHPTPHLPGGLATDGTLLFYTSKNPSYTICRYDLGTQSASVIADLSDLAGEWNFPVEIHDDIAFYAGRLYVTFVTWSDVNGNEMWAASVKIDGSDLRNEGPLIHNSDGVQGLTAIGGRLYAVYTHAFPDDGIHGGQIWVADLRGRRFQVGSIGFRKCCANLYPGAGTYTGNRVWHRVNDVGDRMVHIKDLGGGNYGVEVRTFPELAVVGSHTLDFMPSGGLIGTMGDGPIMYLMGLDQSGGSGSPALWRINTDSGHQEIAVPAWEASNFVNAEMFCPIDGHVYVTSGNTGTMGIVRLNPLTGGVEQLVARDAEWRPNDVDFYPIWTTGGKVWVPVRNESTFQLGVYRYDIAAGTGEVIPIQSEGTLYVPYPRGGSLIWTIDEMPSFEIVTIEVLDDGTIRPSSCDPHDSFRASQMHDGTAIWDSNAGGGVWEFWRSSCGSL